VREHRLYQADWLMRFYEFDADEIFAGAEGGMLELDIDPKLAWALRHRERFPIDVNHATREELLRVPGLGTQAVKRIIAARRIRKLREDDLQRLRVPMRRVRPFIKLPGQPAVALDSERLAAALRPPPHQLGLFASP